MTENMQARWVQSLFAVFVRCCLKEIGQQAFQQCQKLNGITIPDGVIEIKAATFRECKNLSYAIIGDGVRIIDDQAFYLCPNLNTVKIGKSVKSVGDTAFEGCSIKSVYIDSLDIWCDINFEDPTSVPGGTLYIENTPISTVVISSPTQSIRNYAFYRRKELNEVVIQNGITSIGDMSFYGCRCLKKITIPSTVTEFGTGVFLDCNDVVIYCATNSPAHIYAIENGIKVSLTDGDVGGESSSITPLPNTDTVLYADSEHIVLDVTAKTSLYGKVLIVAVYDKDGNLLDLMNFPQARSVTSAYIALPMNESADKVKIFLWDSASSIVPEGVCEELKIENAIDIMK